MINIREAQISDAPSIVQINVMCWQKNYRGIVPDNLLDKMSVSDKRIQRCQQNIQSDMIFLVAEDQGKVVGYLAAQKENNLPYSYEIKWLYIHPQHQRLGIGQKLLTAFRSKINHQPFYLLMIDGNKTAEHFYQKMGGIRQPQYDGDQIITTFSIHEVCFSFQN